MFAALHQRFSASRWLLAVSCLVSCLFAEPASAATGEPILFLGIQRHTAIDRVASDQLMEYLAEHGESVLRSVALHDNERRCRHPQCLEALAHDHRAALVVSGDVSSTGPNNTLRVQVRLFDIRRHGADDGQSDMENLCLDCDETKLGILLANTATNLIQRHRIAHPNPPPLPVQKGPASAPPPSQSAANQADAPPSVPLTMAIPPAAPAQPGQNVQPGQNIQSVPTVQGGPGVPGDVANSNPGQQAAPLPPALPPVDPYYTPPYLGPDPQATMPPKKGLSRNRKILGGVFGALGIGSLIVAAVMTGLDQRLAPNYSYNPNGLPCTSPENIGKTCVMSTVGLYAPLYAVGGLLLGGMVLTLALPESRPRPPPQPSQDGTP
jgi:hypothetical protein